MADGVWTDEDIKNPLNNIVELLQKTSNRTLVRRWGLWLTTRNVDLGLKVRRYLHKIIPENSLTYFVVTNRTRF